MYIHSILRKTVRKECQLVHGVGTQDGFTSISEEIFYLSSPNMVHKSIRARQNQIWTGWPWPHSPGHRGPLRRRHMKDGSCSLSEGIYEILYTEAPGQGEFKDRSGQTWPYFQGHKGYLKLYPLNMWRNIWRILTKFGTQQQQSKTKDLLNVLKLLYPIVGV